MKLIWLAILVCGCSAFSTASEKIGSLGSYAPIVRASDGASAILTIVACPRTLEGGEGLKALLDEMVQYQSELVSARNGGNARLTLNICPTESWLTMANPNLFTKRPKQ